MWRFLSDWRKSPDSFWRIYSVYYWLIFPDPNSGVAGGCTGSTPDSSNDWWNSYEADRRRREEEEERRRRQEEEEARIRAMYDEDDGVFGWDPDHGYWL